MFWAVAVLAMGIAFIQGHTAYTELGKMPPLRKFPQFAHPDVPKDFHWPRPGDQQPQKRVIDQRTTLKTAIWINAAVGVLGFCCLFRQVWAAFLLAGWHLIELILCIAYELTAWTIKVDIGMVVLSTTAIVGWVMARRKRRQAMLELML